MTREPLPSFSDADWEPAVLHSRLPVLAGFWAEWCLPSRSLGPLLEAAARDYDGRLTVGLVNNDENPGLADRYRIQGLPTVVLIDKGREVARRVGLMDRSRVHQLIEAALKVNPSP